jgi:DNA modification methylase
VSRAVEFRKVEDLTKDPNNARTHSPAQVEQIANSIRRFGWTMPALADEVIRAGNGRHAAAELIYQAGETIYLAPGKERGGQAIPAGTMPVMDCTGWSEDERRAYALADNQLALNAEWDDEQLRAELEALTLAGFEIPLIGFDEDELNRIFNPPQSGRTDPDELPAEPPTIATVRGDVWLLGEHRLKCGDATSAEDVDSVLDGCGPGLMVTDPPYGVDYRPAWRNEALPVWKKSWATGTVQNDDRADWHEAWELFAGDVAYVWHADTKRATVEASLTSCGFNVRAVIVWAKQNFVISRGDYHPQHEPCLYLVRKGKKGHWNGDRKQSTVWEIKNGSSVGGGTSDDKHTGHGTQKPVECMLRPIRNNSKPGDLVYEPFSGSGTTLIACEMEGRRCRAIELSEEYVDMAVLRWQDFTGEAARLEATGQTFAEVTAARAPEEAAA